MVQSVFKLVSKSVTTANGNDFITYQLLTNTGKWYRISYDPKLRPELEKLAGKVVEVDIDHIYDKKVNNDPSREPLYIPTVAVMGLGIRLATDEETTAYNEVIDAQTKAQLD